MHLLIADGVADPEFTRRGDSILVHEGKVAAVGWSNELEAGADTSERLGGFLIPGLRDAHFHPVLYAAGLAVPVLKDATNFHDLSERLRHRASQLPPGQPLSAIRLDDETLEEGRLPTRADLDEMVSDRPVLAHRYCGHIAVANSAALKAAGIDGDTPDPPGGSIDRAADGIPTGVLREMAVELVSLRLAATAEPMVDTDLFKAAMDNLAAIGLTGIGAMVSTGSGPWAEFGDHLDLILDCAADLPIKLGLIVIADSPGQLRHCHARIAEEGSDRAAFLGVKIFADGSLGGHTAFMYEPFSDKPTTGQSRLEPGRDLALARASLELGGLVAVHAIGDQANHQVLDMFEQLVHEGADGAQLRLEHASVLSRADIARIGELGIIASVQPPFLESETEWLERRVGPERLSRTYPFRSLLDAGAVLAGGSDCPVEPPFPLSGIAAAIDRCGLVPAEAISPAAALSMYTAGAARALNQPPPFAENSPADLAVLDLDPLTATPAELRRARVLATYVDGRPVAFDHEATVWKG
jgi:predicted amidohydrolase YtcJ